MTLSLMPTMLVGEIILILAIWEINNLFLMLILVIHQVSINQECSNLINLGLNTSQNKGTSLEDLVKSLATSSLQFQQEARTTIKNLETQVSQLASTVGKLEAQGSGKLPSQTIVNAREMWLHLFQELNFLAVPWLIFLFFVLLQVVFHSSTSQN